MLRHERRDVLGGRVIRPRAIAATLVVVLAASRAAADPLPPVPENVVITSPGAILDVAMRKFDVPRGTRLLSPRKWLDLDTEVRRLQDAETRLTTENKYMRERVESWQPGWRLLATTLVTSLVVGGYLGHRYL